MIGVYVGAALFGGIVIGVSLLFGGHEGDADHEVDHDHDHDVEADVEHDHEIGHDHAIDKGLDVAKVSGSDLHWLWFPLLSLRFWTFAAASAGITGSLLTLFGFGEPWTALISFPFGAAIGWGTAQVFRQMRTDHVTGDVKLTSYAGLEAKVVVPVRPGEKGKIAVQTLSGRVEMLAKTQDGKVLDAGSVVLITSVVGDTADVTQIGSAPTPGATTSESAT